MVSGQCNRKITVIDLLTDLVIYWPLCRRKTSIISWWLYRRCDWPRNALQLPGLSIHAASIVQYTITHTCKCNFVVQKRRGGGAFREAGRRQKRCAQSGWGACGSAGYARAGCGQRQPHDWDVRHQPRRQPRQDRVHGSLVQHVRKLRAQTTGLQSHPWSPAADDV